MSAAQLKHRVSPGIWQTIEPVYGEDGKVKAVRFGKPGPDRPTEAQYREDEQARKQYHRRQA